MELELATTHQIADELANRGVQFIIAIQTIGKKEEPFKLHLCIDSHKDEKSVVEAIAPFFDVNAK